MPIKDKVWQPFKRQEDFLSIPDSVFEALYGGAAGGGKSELLLLFPIAREFYKHPKFKGILLRRTYKELEDEIIWRSHEYYPATGAKYNEQKKFWSWPCGSRMSFGHAEHESDIRIYDSAQYNYIAFDELTSFTEFQYRYMVSRCRTATPELPAIMRSGSNPGNIGHGFVRTRFIEPCRTGYKIIRDSLTKTSRIFIPSKATDNPHLLKANPNYINQLNILPEAERLAKRDGDWWTFTGQVFSEFRVSPLQDEPANACHVVKPFNIPPYWPTILFIDWGYSAMTYAGWISVNPSTKQLFLKREYSCRRTKITEWALRVKDLSISDWLVDIVLDPSAWSNRGEEFNIAQQFEQASSLRPRKADNDRISGKILLQELLRWRQVERKVEEYDDDLANKILEIGGLDRYKEYMNSFLPQNPEILPKLQIFDTCTTIINTIPLCVYVDPIKNPKNKEDVAEFDGDDPYDALRYGIKAAQSYLEVGIKEVEYQNQVSKNLEEFNKTHDMTELHIKMSSLRKPNRNTFFRGRRRRYLNI